MNLCVTTYGTFSIYTYFVSWCVDESGRCEWAVCRCHLTHTPYTVHGRIYNEHFWWVLFFLCVSATAVGWGKIEGDRMALDKGPSHSVEYRNAIFGRQIYISPMISLPSPTLHTPISLELQFGLTVHFSFVSVTLSTKKYDDNDSMQWSTTFQFPHDRIR